MNNQAQLSPPLKEQHNLNQPPLRHNLDHSGGTTVARVIEDIIKAASVQIRHNKILARHLNRFSKDQTIQNIDAVNSMFFNMGGNKQRNDSQQDQPKPLYVDSLLPISADVDAENGYKKNLKKVSVLEESSVRVKFTRDSLPDFKQKYRKLQLTEASEEDPFTKQLRRATEDNKKKAQTDRKAEERLMKLKLEKQKARKNEDKVSYDYNGNMVEIKVENKKNLISALIDGNTDQKARIVKEAKNDQHPTTLQGVNPNKAKIKKIEMAPQTSKKKDEVQFSNVNSLADSLKTTYGVKYTYEGKTYEEKKRVITTKDIKRSLSQKRLSREQFELLKRLNTNNREQFEQSLKNSTIKANVSEVKHLRTQSEIKLSNVAVKKSPDTIHISDPILKNKLLEKVAQSQEPNQDQPVIKKDEHQTIRLGSINSFNLEYIKTGGSLKTNTSRQFFSKGANQLPRISHTTLYSQTKPKGRERIKDANEIFREMRKRFQQKLRV